MGFVQVLRFLALCWLQAVIKFLQAVIKFTAPRIDDKKRQSLPVTGPVVAQRVGTDIALLFHDLGARRG